MIPEAWLDEAVERIAPQLRTTPLTYDPKLGIYLKWENKQVTGSFKIRGALNKVMSLQSWEQAAGLVAASAGNHGQGVAMAARLVGADCTVFASEHAFPTKVEAMRALGARVCLVEGGYAEAERAGMAFAAETKSTWVSPYNDPQVIAGQASLGREVIRQLEEIQTGCVWVVPAGGGGLVSGIGMSITNLKPRPHLTAVQSTASPFLFELFQGGCQEDVQELPSLADGLAGEVEPGSVTIPLTKRCVNEFLLVSEEEIAKAIAYAWIYYGEAIEGSAAVSLAAVLSGKVSGRPAVVFITGGNVQPEVHRDLIARYANFSAEEGSA